MLPFLTQQQDPHDMIDSSEPQSILELADVGDAVFIDNLMMCSADRLISGRYNPLNDKFGQDSSEALALLFHHDVLNLAIFVESIVCHERIFVNAEYTDRWNNSIQKDLLQHLNKIIRPVAWPKDARAIAEHELVRVAQSMENTGGVSALADIVFRRTHHGFRYDSGKISRFQREHFLPFEEGSTYWGSPIYIALAAGPWLGTQSERPTSLLLQPRPRWRLETTGSIAKWGA